MTSEVTVMPGDSLTFTVTEVAKLLGISRGAAYEGVREGQIPALRIGRRILIPKAALERLLEQSASAAEHDHTRAQ